MTGVTSEPFSFRTLPSKKSYGRMVLKLKGSEGTQDLILKNVLEMWEHRAVGI